MASAPVWNIPIQQELIEYLLHARQTCKILGYNLNPAVFITIWQNIAYGPRLGKPLKIPALFSLQDDQQKHGFGYVVMLGFVSNELVKGIVFHRFDEMQIFPLKKQILLLKSI